MTKFGGNMGNMMKQAKKIQAKMAKMQDEMAEKTVEASAGGGMVKVVVNGKNQLLSLDIEKEVVDPEDVEMLQDLIIAVINDAFSKSKKMADSEMGKLAQGIGLPPGML